MDFYYTYTNVVEILYKIKYFSSVSNDAAERVAAMAASSSTVLHLVVLIKI